MIRYEWRLEEVAQKAGLSYGELAQRFGCDRSYMFRLFKYKHVPTISGPELQKLLGALGCPLEELIVAVEDEGGGEEE